MDDDNQKNASLFDTKGKPSIDNGPGLLVDPAAMDSADENQPHHMASTSYDEKVSPKSDNLPSNVTSMPESYPSTDHVSESESDDSESHGEHPTEASDNSLLPVQLSGDSDEKPLNIPFHPQPSQDRDDDIRSPSDDAVAYQETLSSMPVDFSSIHDIKPIGSVTPLSKHSSCEPCTIEKDEIIVIKETVTTTTLSTKDTEPKKEKNDLGHIMISYNHSTKVICSRIAQALKDLQYRVWIDQDNISGNIITSMASAVENAFVVLMAINEPYYQSRYCRLEAEYSLESNKASIPMLMQKDYKATGWLGLINGSKLHIDFSQYHFDDAFNLLVREIESIRLSLGADENSQTSVVTSFGYGRSMMTTTSNSWLHFENVHEWNAGDVVEWLNREKLEVFEYALMNFTGATLWQLYKVKFDSAPDYYRMVESLLPANTPLRLLHNLTFHGAIESLFSSSKQSKF